MILHGEMVIAMHADGLTDTEMEERSGVNRKRIGAIRRELGLKSNYVRSNIIELGGGVVECTKCGRELPKSGLPWGRTTTHPYQLSYCRQCLTASAIANTSKSLPQYLKHRMRALKARARTSKVTFDLPSGHLADLWEKQRGLCFYTDSPMQVYFGTGRSGSRRDSLSVDRLVPDRGYIAGNVVLCCSRINTIKQDCTLDEMAEWMPGWHSRITAHLAKQEEMK